MARKRKKKNRDTKLILPKLPKEGLQDLVTQCKYGEKNLAMYVRRDQTIYCAASFQAICQYQEANYFEGEQLYICRKYNRWLHDKKKKS